MKPGELQVAMVFRADLPTMTRAKSEIQAAHGAMDLVHRLMRTDPVLVDAYMDDNQPKANLEVDDLPALERVAERAVRRGVPHVLVVDEGRTCFEGPTATMLIIGPMTRTDSNNVTRGLRRRDPPKT